MPFQANSLSKPLNNDPIHHDQLGQNSSTASASSPSSSSSNNDDDDVETVGQGARVHHRNSFKSWIKSHLTVQEAADWDWKSILLSIAYGQILSAILSG